MKVSSIPDIIEIVSYIATATIGFFTIRLSKRMNNITEYDRRKNVFLRTKQFFRDEGYKKESEKENLSLDINNVFKKKIGKIFGTICIDFSKLSKLQFDMTEVMDLLKNENFEEYIWIQNMDWSTDDRAELTRAKKFLDDLCYMSSDTEIDGGMRELSYREIEKEIEELKNKISSEQKILYSIMEKKLKLKLQMVNILLVILM